MVKVINDQIYAAAHNLATDLYIPDNVDVNKTNYLQSSLFSKKLITLPRFTWVAQFS